MNHLLKPYLIVISTLSHVNHISKVEYSGMILKKSGLKIRKTFGIEESLDNMVLNLDVGKGCIDILRLKISYSSKDLE